MKKQHEELRTKNVYLSIFPNQYTDIVNAIKNPINGISNHLIYFLSKTDTKVTTFNYSLPETCIVYMVFELLDEVGPITFRDGKNNVFTFSNINYKLPGEPGFKLKIIELKRKYVLAFKIKNKKVD